MTARELGISRRSIAISATLVGAVSLAIGAHAALNRPALDTAIAITTEYNGDMAKKPSRIALVVGNGHYPDADAPLTQPINDARALAVTLRRNGFDVDVMEDASEDDMRSAVNRLKSKIGPESVAMLFFGGYGIQAGSESYMIPVDAAIWQESDVRRDGLSIEAVLDVMKAQGAHARLVVIDASRRNPYERRFRRFSRGLAPINAPDNALILTSAAPEKVADDSKDQHSVLMAELLNNLNGREGAPRSCSTRRALRSHVRPTTSRSRRYRHRCLLTFSWRQPRTGRLNRWQTSARAQQSILPLAAR